MVRHRLTGGTLIAVAALTAGLSMFIAAPSVAAARLDKPPRQRQAAKSKDDTPAAARLPAKRGPAAKAKADSGVRARSGGRTPVTQSKAAENKPSAHAKAVKMNAARGREQTVMTHNARGRSSSAEPAKSAKNHERQAEATARPRLADKPNLRPPVPPPNIIPLTAAEQLGKNIFFDATLSNPPGQSCATCHLPSAGFTGSSSHINAATGQMPGAVPGRVGRRKPQSVTYAAFSPTGPYYNQELGVFLGGTFWDGRTPDTTGQARMPFLDADEMANTPVGPYPPHAGGFSPLVALKLQQGPYSALFVQVFGPNVFDSSEADIYALATQAIAAYEASAEVNQFSSKFDASEFGTPPSNGYRLNPSEMNGMSLFFGKAQCFQCHSSANLAPVLAVTGGKEAFTMYCYSNVGVPKNPNNPFYHTTNSVTNPDGSNALGVHFIDYGLGMNPNPAPDGTRFMTSTVGDIPAYRGLFKAPSLRNVDLRPNRTFVKAYMHNAVFKNLEEVVHFYNKRNIAVNGSGDEVPFDLRVGPPTGYTRLILPPEVLDNVQNVAGFSPANAGAEVSNNGQVGNLGLTRGEERDLVNFMKTLTDGYTGPNPVEDDD
jgi:cytochrome c peroxidase